MAEERVSYAFTEELDLIQSTARQFLEERLDLETVRELMMSEEGFDRGLWKEISDLGWTGLAIDEAYGGSGYGMVEMTALLEVMGRFLTPGPFFATAVLAASAIGGTATASQKAELLPGLASGDTIATLAVFEQQRDWSGTGGGTTATADGDGWVLDGAKRYVLDAASADLFVVAASDGDGTSLFTVPASSEGVSVEATPTLDATRRQGNLMLSEVRVPSSARLGDAPADAGLARTLRLGTVALSAEQVGGTSWCLDTSVEYAKSRHQFGRPIGSYQAIKHRCAEMLIKLEHAKSAAYHAARVTEDEEELAVAAPLAGSICSEAYLWAAGETIQIHGGIGFTWEHDAHLFFKRAKASSLLLGDPRYHRDLLGRAIGV